MESTLCAGNPVHVDGAPIPEIPEIDPGSGFSGFLGWMFPGTQCNLLSSNFVSAFTRVLLLGGAQLRTGALCQWALSAEHGERVVSTP